MISIEKTTWTRRQYQALLLVAMQHTKNFSQKTTENPCKNTLLCLLFVCCVLKAPKIYVVAHTFAPIGHGCLTWLFMVSISSFVLLLLLLLCLLCSKQKRCSQFPFSFWVSSWTRSMLQSHTKSSSQQRRTHKSSHHLCALSLSFTLSLCFH